MGSAVVIGAGIGGLAVAGALARADWQVTLLERNDRLRARPRRAADLAERYRGAAANSASAPASTRSRAPVLDRGIRRPGRPVARPSRKSSTPDAGPPVVVHREDLHDALIAGLGDRIDNPHRHRRPAPCATVGHDGLGLRRRHDVGGRPDHRCRRRRQHRAAPARPGVDGRLGGLHGVAGGHPVVPRVRPGRRCSRARPPGRAATRRPAASSSAPGTGSAGP